MIKNYIKCGVIGWCIEIVWTGFGALTYKDYSMTSTTSIWMFPIYGLAFLIKPLYSVIRNENFIIRGGIYTAGIFSVEFISGIILKSFNICPWDYSYTPYNIAGVIRLDYAPAWFLAGLLYERILVRPDKSPSK